MRTDIFVQLFSDTRDEWQMEQDLDRAFALFRDFESRFSRFQVESELSLLNQSTTCRVSQDLYAILALCARYFEETGGVFDPTILPVLEQEGYQWSFGTAHFGKSLPLLAPTRRFTWADIQMDARSCTLSKPLACRIDLGGIGKGYAVDCVVKMLSPHYRNFLVDAGGDMYAAGGNRGADLPYFAIDIENPFEAGASAGLLLVSHQAVATSGVNRRRWQQKGKEKSHLIDTQRNASLAGDIVTATVLAPSVVRADVLAKTLCMLGAKQALLFAERKQLPVCLLLKDGTIQRNDFLKPFLWEN
jgi:thiamine biosynthesis lipoprotein